jgi:CRISPR type IV-associated protein Csf1
MATGESPMSTDKDIPQVASQLFAKVESDAYQAFLEANRSKEVMAFEDTFCAVTGIPIDSGDIVHTFSLGKNFNDQWSLHDMTLPYVLPEVAFSMTAYAIRTSFSTVVSEDGVEKISKLADFADKLLHPPCPPFAFCYGNAKQQHLLWRTPVNYSRAVFDIRVGKRILTIDLGEVLEAYGYTQSIFSEKGIYQDPKKKIPLASPYVIRGVDTVSLKNDTIGVIRKEVIDYQKEHPEDEAVNELIEKCSTYSFSTKWALSLLYVLNK